MTTLCTAGSSALRAVSLAIWVVLGEDDLALGVAQDVRRVLLVGGGVHRRRGRGRAHDAEVGEDPLVARAGHDPDALLGLHPKGQQPGGDPLTVLAGLLPGDGLPGVPSG